MPPFHLYYSQWVKIQQIAHLFFLLTSDITSNVCKCAISQSLLLQNYNDIGSKKRTMKSSFILFL